MAITISTEKVDAQAYKGRTDITEVIFSDAVKVIGREAFSGCTALTSITLPSGLEYIGDRAFYGCTASLKVSHKGDSEGDCELLYIGVGAFEGCTKLSGGIRFSSKLENISDRAFYNCSGTSSSNSIGFSAPKGSRIRHIGNYAFYNCRYTNPSNALGDYLESIGDYAFYNTRITELWCDNSLSIGEYAFNNCAALTNVHTPNVISIGKGAFYYCTKLARVILGTNLKRIEADTFVYCTPLEYIDIPCSVLYIGLNAFYGCGNGMLVVNLGTHTMCPEMSDYAFDYCYDVILLLPDGKYSQWSTLLNPLNNSDSIIHFTKLSEGNADYYVPSYIRFNIGTRTFVAEKGMTWEEWAESLHAKVYVLEGGNRDLNEYALSGYIMVDGRNVGNTVYSYAINWPSADSVKSVGYLNGSSITRVKPTDSITNDATYAVTGGLKRVLGTWDDENGEWTYQDN